MLTFLSAILHAIVAEFEKNGIRCWYAPRDIVPGASWVSAITEAIQSVKVQVLVFTDESNVSRQVMNEVAVAFNEGKTIVPFRLTDAKMSGEFEYYLSRVHWLDAVKPPLNDNVVQLRQYVGDILSGADKVAGISEQPMLPIQPTVKGRQISPATLIGIIAALLVVFILIVLLLLQSYKSYQQPGQSEPFISAYGDGGGADGHDTAEGGSISDGDTSTGGETEGTSAGTDAGDPADATDPTNTTDGTDSVNTADTTDSSDTTDTKDTTDSTDTSNVENTEAGSAEDKAEGDVTDSTTDTATDDTSDSTTDNSKTTDNETENTDNKSDSTTGAEKSGETGKTTDTEDKSSGDKLSSDSSQETTDSGKTDKTDSGKTEEKDVSDMTVEELERAAKKGNVEACDELGAMYYDGEGVDQDYGKALLYLNRADENNTKSARTYKLLGNMYYMGKGVEESDATSGKYYAKAIELGIEDPAVWSNYGMILYRDDNFSESAKYFAKAAKSNKDPMTMYNAGLAYYGAEDYDIALTWFGKTIEGGYSRPDDVRRQIQSMVDAGQISEKDAKKWLE